MVICNRAGIVGYSTTPRTCPSFPSNGRLCPCNQVLMIVVAKAIEFSCRFLSLIASKCPVYPIQLYLVLFLIDDQV